MNHNFPISESKNCYLPKNDIVLFFYTHSLVLVFFKRRKNSRNYAARITVDPISPIRIFENATVACGFERITSSGLPLLVGHVPRCAPGCD